MIERLQGVCIAKYPASLIIDVAGVGYGVEMSDADLNDICEGQEGVVLWIYTVVREDAIRLMGFLTHEARAAFALLLQVSGVGPKVGMAIVGAIGVNELVRAVEDDDPSILEEVPGVGQRQSKKIVLELKPKLTRLILLKHRTHAAAKTASPTVQRSLFAETEKPKLSSTMLQDLKSALENYGYKDKELQDILKRIAKNPPAQDLIALVRYALSELSGRKTETVRDIEGIF